MRFFEKLKDFFKKVFRIKSKSSDEPKKEVVIDDTPSVEELEKELEEIEKFKMRNIVYEKLNYLEQYIKVFSLQFPSEYLHYLERINAERKEYETELSKYSDGLNGELTFAIDPECESGRLIAVSNLEIEIKDFVELVVNYNIYKDKFSKLMLKLNQFYNALLDTNRENHVVASQLNNAVTSLTTLFNKAKGERFFLADTRKKEEFLNFVIYAEYIFFKSSLRCGLADTFDEYKNNNSKFYNLFVESEYDDLVFKYFIEDLEHYQNYITTNIKDGHIVSCCQKLQSRLRNYATTFSDSTFFVELIQFENTVDNIADNSGVEFVFPLPSFITCCNPENKVSVKNTAVSLLSMLETNRAKILTDVLRGFKEDISWREFFFLTKIFELYDDVLKVSVNTIFNFVHSKFVTLSSKYTEYSDFFIRSEKQKLLSYHGSKKKKYILFMECEDNNLQTVSYELRNLYLDFHVSGNRVYLNHSYFNGFKNLETNFGEYKLLEDI